MAGTSKKSARKQKAEAENTSKLMDLLGRMTEQMIANGEEIILLLARTEDLNKRLEKLEPKKIVVGEEVLKEAKERGV